MGLGRGDQGATQRFPATPISPKGGGGTASISLSLLLHDVTDIALSSLRELDAVAIATNDMVFMGRDTSSRPMNTDPEIVTISLEGGMP